MSQRSAPPRVCGIPWPWRILSHMAEAARTCSTYDQMQCGAGPKRPEGAGYPKRVCIPR